MTQPVSFFSSRSDWIRVMVLCFVLAVSASVRATPANCDADMTEDQRFQADLCSAHAGCRFVIGIADTCIKAKSFLSKLGLSGKGSSTKVTDDQVSYALMESGVPQSGISRCLFDFDLPKCKEYLSGGPKQPSAKDQADDIASRLNSKVYSTTAWDAGLGLAKEGLRMCDDATNTTKVRHVVRAKERCSLAEGNIRACLLTKEGHDELRKTLQSLIDNGDLGDAAGYRSLANTPYPVCPTTLPNSSKTPNAALADYLKFWDTPEKDTQKADEDKAGSVIARCEPMRRDTSDAIDNDELDRASGLVGQFEAACSRENQTYAGLARIYRQRLVEALQSQPTVALPRRSGNAGSALFQSAINQAEQDERDPAAREARERAAEQERLKRERVAADVRTFEQEQARKSAQNTREALGLLVGAIGQYQQAKQGKQLEQQRLQEQQDQYQEQQRRIREQQERLNRPASAQAERTPSSSQSSTRVHNPANEAASCISFFKEKNTSIQMKNNCSYDVSVSWPGGLVIISPGHSHPSWEQSNFRFIACRYGGPNGAGLWQTTEMSRRNEYICRD